MQKLRMYEMYLENARHAKIFKVFLRVCIMVFEE